MEDSDNERRDHRNVHQRWQAAPKAAPTHREMLLEGEGREEEEDEAPSGRNVLAVMEIF